MNDREKDFIRWVFELEIKFKDAEKKFPRDLDTWLLQSNVRGYDRIFEQLPNRCSAPGCGYPIRDTTENFRVVLYGDVCNLCYQMYQAALIRPGLVEAQRLYLESKARKKRLE